MKALSLWQPWASLIAVKLKHYETRSWATPYRGQLAIHAAKRKPKREECLAILSKVDRELIGNNAFDRLLDLLSYPSLLPLGCIVATSNLTGCLRMINNLSESPSTTINIHLQSTLEQATGDWQTGRCAWRLDTVLALPQPIPYIGSQGLFNLDSDTIEQINKVTA